MRLTGCAIGFLLSGVGCGAHEPPSNVTVTGGGGQAALGGGGQAALAGMTSRPGSDSVAGGGQAAPAGSGGAAGAGGGATGAGGGAAGVSSGGFSNDAGSSGSGGVVGAGGASFTYEPIQDPKWDEMPIYDGDPPNFVADAPAETLEDNGHIGNVSVPTLRRYAMDGSKATGYGYLVFPGGGYSILDMDTHAAKLAERVGPLGIAVFSLKYRVGAGTNDAPRDALLDAKRAIRLVKENAAHWAVSVPHLGIIGYSAGSHLALNLAANFDAGNPAASDAIEKQSSRPAFVGSMSTWSFGSKTSPFTFPADVPPAFFCHAQDDTTAPIELPKAVELQIRTLGPSTRLDFYDTGGHSTCHPGDPTMPGHNWPDKFWPWVQAALQ